MQSLDHQLGVDRPLITQYLSWIGGLLHGNLGESYTYQSAVAPFIGAALINSLKLAALAFVIVVPLSIFGGVIAALYNGRSVDRIISVTGASLSTVPEFVSGIVLIVVFGVGSEVAAGHGRGRGGRQRGKPARAPDIAGYNARLYTLRLHCPYGQGGDDRGTELRLHAHRDPEGTAAESR